MTGYADHVSETAVFVPKAEQNDITEIVVAMKKKAVIPIHPAFPRKASDILRTDRQDLTSALVLKRLDLRIGAPQLLPQLFRVCRYVLGVLKITKHLRILQLR